MDRKEVIALLYRMYRGYFEMRERAREAEAILRNRVPERLHNLPPCNEQEEAEFAVTLKKDCLSLIHKLEEELDLGKL